MMQKANKDLSHKFARPSSRVARPVKNPDVICVHFKSRVPLANVGRCICEDAKAAGLRVAVMMIERD